MMRPLQILSLSLLIIASYVDARRFCKRGPAHGAGRHIEVTQGRAAEKAARGRLRPAPAFLASTGGTTVHLQGETNALKNATNGTEAGTNASSTTSAPKPTVCERFFTPEECIHEPSGECGFQYDDECGLAFGDCLNFKREGEELGLPYGSCRSWAEQQAAAGRKGVCKDDDAILEAEHRKEEQAVESSSQEPWDLSGLVRGGFVLSFKLTTTSSARQTVLARSWPSALTDGTGLPYGVWQRGQNGAQGKLLFIGHGGKVCFDIGWVGFDCAEAVVADGQEHVVEITNSASTGGRYAITVDAAPSAASQGKLRATKDDPATAFGLGHPVGHDRAKVNPDMGVALAGTVREMKLVYADGVEGMPARKAVKGYAV